MAMSNDYQQDHTMIYIQGYRMAGKPGTDLIAIWGSGPDAPRYVKRAEAERIIHRLRKQLPPPAFINRAWKKIPV